MIVVSPKEKFGLAKLEEAISSHLGRRIDWLMALNDPPHF